MKKIAIAIVLFIAPMVMSAQNAWASFEDWKDRFSRQGYYSTFRNGQRVQIPLGELKAYCTLKEINS